MKLRYPLARPSLDEAEIAAVRRVLESGWVAQGPMVREFESQVATYTGAAHAVAVSSCTAALHLALLCAGVGTGDEVIVPSMSFIATANAVVHAGATPVFAEVEPNTFNLDIDDVRTRIGPRTRAIVLVHQLGLPADRDAFGALASERGIAIVEDAACAIGTRVRGTPIGADGALVCLSFHPRKVLTTGEGGMVLTTSEDHAARLRRLRQQGMSISDLDRHGSARVMRESYEEIGFNYRLTDLQAAVGIEQLKKLPAILAKRQSLATAYGAAFAGSTSISGPQVPEDVDWNVQSYAVRLTGFDAERRDKVMQLLLDEGIASRPGVMTAHTEPAYTQRGPAPSLPASEAASAGSLILPLYGEMSSDDCGIIAAALVEAVDAVS
jgi:dTDP-4-amino-4,6-dideoxygalactose transaminase